MPPAGRAAVGFAKLFELSLLSRFGACKTQALFLGWWRLRQICSSLSVQWCSMSNDLWVCGFLRLPHLCLRPQNAKEWMTANCRGLEPRDLLYCSVRDRRLDRLGQEWTRVWLAATRRACTMAFMFHWCSFSSKLPEQPSILTIRPLDHITHKVFCQHLRNVTSGGRRLAANTFHPLHLRPQTPGWCSGGNPDGTGWNHCSIEAGTCVVVM